jgi:glutamyl-tRNA reductase
MNLLVIGLNHRTAPVEVREQLATIQLSQLLATAALREAVLLSTCNRVEVYGLGDANAAAAIRHFLRDSPHLYELRDRDCVRHLGEVVSGLDSMVLGETEILGQAKTAYLAAQQAGATGIALNRLFQKAFSTGKHIRTNTAIARGSTSVGNVAVDLAQQIFRNLAPCTVMVVGTGEMSEATAKALHSRGAGTIMVCSRSHERAQAVAGQLGGQAISYDDWPARFPAVDIVISATAAPHPIITREKLIPLMKTRHQRPLFLIDIAVPRDIERTCGELENVFLYDIDDLQQIASQNVAAREREIAGARAIIAEHAERFWCWFELNLKQDRTVAPGDVAFSR